MKTMTVLLSLLALSFTAHAAEDKCINVQGKQLCEFISKGSAEQSGRSITYDATQIKVTSLKLSIATASGTIEINRDSSYRGINTQELATGLQHLAGTLEVVYHFKLFGVASEIQYALETGDSKSIATLTSQLAQYISQQ